MPGIRDFDTWQPLLALIRDSDPDGFGWPGARVDGRVSRDQVFGWSAWPDRSHELLGAALTAARRGGTDPVGALRAAVTDASLPGISFIVTFPGGGRVVLTLLELGPAVEAAGGVLGLGSLLLAEDALPALWRRQPDPVPGARPAPSADPPLLQRTLRQRLPDAAGASEAEIAAAGARLGVRLPAELAALYGVTRGDPRDWGGDSGLSWQALGFDPLPLAGVHAATPGRPRDLWTDGAFRAAFPTAPGAAVQALLGSHGWIVIGYDAAGDRVAVDLTPGPRGHLGQVIVISADGGAALLASSLTELITGSRDRDRAGFTLFAGFPAVAHVRRDALGDVESAASPDLEVLVIGTRDGTPVSLAPVAGLPRLRTLSAAPGALANPQDVALLPALEYLELGTGDWRALLRAGAVPPGLLAAGIRGADEEDPLEVVQLVNALLALRGRPPVITTVLEGRVA